MHNQSRFIKNSSVTIGLLFSAALAVFAAIGQAGLSKPVSANLLSDENIPLAASVRTYAAGSTLNPYNITADGGDFDLSIKQDLYRRTNNSAAAQQPAANAVQANADQSANSTQPADSAQPACQGQSENSQQEPTVSAARTLAGDAGSAAKTVASVEKPVSYKFINANELNVRSGAGTNYDKVATLKRGDKVGVISGSGEWTKIQTSSGKTGYILSEYLVAKESDVEPAQPAAYRYVNADTLNVRSGAGTDYDKVATLKRGDKVGFFDKSGEWARIRTSSGKTGYVLSKYLVEDEGSVSRGSSAGSGEVTSLAQQITNYATKLQGVNYIYGGYSTSGFDCSGFVKYVYAHFGITVPRSSSEYASFGVKVSRDNLRPSDILLFDTDGGRWDVSHVGIYLGGDKFIHASTLKGEVVIMSLSDYRGKFYGARRVID